MKKISLLFFLTMYFAVRLYAQPITGSSQFCVSSTTTYAHAVSGGTWSSSTPAVATIHPTTGVATGVFAGTTTITYIEGVTTTTKTVTVGTSVPAMTGSSTTCLASSVTLSHSYAGGTWSSSGVHIATINSTTGVVTPVAAGATFITYTLGSNCRTVRSLTVNPLPGVISGTMAICQGGTTTLSSATVGGTWASGNLSVATINSSTGLVTGVGTGTSTISYTAATGCMRTAIVTVNAALGAITGSPIVCVGNTFATLVAPVSGGTWSSSNTSVITTHSTTGLLTGIGAGNATITYTKSAGCRATIEATVNTLASITGLSSMCNGLSITLANATSGGAWSSSNTTRATVGAGTGVVTGVGAGTAFISYTMSSGCFKTKVVTVNALPSTINGSATICTGNTSTLTNTTLGGTWSSSASGVATIGTSGIVTGVTAGTSTISYVLGTGCLSTRVVTVSLMPNSITGTLALCAGSTTSLSSTTPGGAWTSFFTSIATVNSSTGLVTGVSGGNSNITYTLGSCYRLSTVSVTALPAAISGPLTMCVGNTTTLASATTGGAWSSSDGTKATVNATTGLVTGIAAGTATISYTKTGCSRTVVVTVNSLAGITGTATMCTGGTTALANATGGGVWYSSNTARATVGAGTGVVTGVSLGTANITYTINSSCFQVLEVSVNALPNTITGTASVCEGATTTLSTTSTGGAWSSGTSAVASIGTGGIVSGVSGGTSIISYTLSGCSRTNVVTVTALPASITGTLAFCAGTSSALASATTGGTWTSGDVTKATINATTGLATGIGAGTSSISYTKSGCRTTAVVTVSSLASITGTASLCVGATTTLAHVSGGGTWTSSDVAKATVGAGTGIVTGVSAGTVRITYEVGSSCYQTVIATVNPLPNVITGIDTVCEGSTRTFTTSSTGGTWSSGTPGVATVSVAGVVTGVDAGNSVITYQFSTGCQRTRTITVNTTPDAISGPTSVCTGNTVTLSSAPGGGTWTSYFTSRASINSTSGIASGLSAGTTIITYSIGSGCRVTSVLSVLPTPASITGVLLLCNASNTQLASPTISGTWSSTDLTKATVNATTGLVTGTGVGTSIISYTVGSCSRSAVATVNAAVGAITGDAVVCVGQTTATLTGPGGGTWTSSNTSVATIHSLTRVLTGIGTGTTTITYKVSAGCYSTTVASVNAAVANITGTLVLCEGVGTSDLDNVTSGGTWSSSNTAIATINATTGVVSGLDNGTTTVSYVLSAGCYKTSTFVVNTVPTPFDGLSMTVTETDTIHISSIAGGTWTSEHPLIATVAPGTPGVGIVTGVSPGAATISYTLPTGCLRTGTITVVSLRPGANNNGTVNIGAELKVYPNPTSGMLSIEAPVNGTFKVYTIDGKEVATYQVTASVNMVNLPSELATGIYMCRFNGADGTSAIVRLVYEQ
jgi:trimeric autotransporter adhesin